MTVRSTLYISFLIVSFCITLLFVGGNGLSGGKSRLQDCFERETKTVRGNSMAPLLLEGDEVVVADGFYRCHSVRRSDIVILDLAPDLDSPILIKRVVGIPGDVFDFVDDPNGSQWLLVNGIILVNSEGKEYVFTGQNTLRLYEGMYGNGLPADTYIVLGDDPSGSHDSSVFGLISQEALIGKVLETRE